MHFGMSAGTHHLVSVVSAEFDIWAVPSGSSVVKLLAVTTPRSCHRPPNYPLESARYNQKSLSALRFAPVFTAQASIKYLQYRGL